LLDDSASKTGHTWSPETLGNEFKAIDQRFDAIESEPEVVVTDSQTVTVDGSALPTLVSGRVATASANQFVSPSMPGAGTWRTGQTEEIRFTLAAGFKYLVRVGALPASPAVIRIQVAGRQTTSFTGAGIAIAGDDPETGVAETDLFVVTRTVDATAGDVVVTIVTGTGTTTFQGPHITQLGDPSITIDGHDVKPKRGTLAGLKAGTSDIAKSWADKDLADWGKWLLTDHERRIALLEAANPTETRAPRAPLVADSDGKPAGYKWYDTTYGEPFPVYTVIGPGKGFTLENEVWLTSVKIVFAPVAPSSDTTRNYGLKILKSDGVTPYPHDTWTITARDDRVGAWKGNGPTVGSTPTDNMGYSPAIATTRGTTSWVEFTPNEARLEGGYGGWSMNMPRNNKLVSVELRWSNGKTKLYPYDIQGSGAINAGDLITKKEPKPIVFPSPPGALPDIQTTDALRAEMDTRFANHLNDPDNRHLSAEQFLELRTITDAVLGTDDGTGQRGTDGLGTIVTEHEEKIAALEAATPDLAGYATETFVNEAIAAIPDPDTFNEVEILGGDPAAPASLVAFTPSTGATLQTGVTGTLLVNNGAVHRVGRNTDPIALGGLFHDHAFTIPAIYLQSAEAIIRTALAKTRTNRLTFLISDVVYATVDMNADGSSTILDEFGQPMAANAPVTQFFDGDHRILQLRIFQNVNTTVGLPVTVRFPIASTAAPNTPAVNNVQLATLYETTAPQALVAGEPTHAILHSRDGKALTYDPRAIATNASVDAKIAAIPAPATPNPPTVISVPWNTKIPLASVDHDGVYIILAGNGILSAGPQVAIGIPALPAGSTLTINGATVNAQDDFNQIWDQPRSILTRNGNVYSWDSLVPQYQGAAFSNGTNLTQVMMIGPGDRARGMTNARMVAQHGLKLLFCLQAATTLQEVVTQWNAYSDAAYQISGFDYAPFGSGFSGANLANPMPAGLYSISYVKGLDVKQLSPPPITTPALGASYRVTGPNAAQDIGTNGEVNINTATVLAGTVTTAQCVSGNRVAFPFTGRAQISYLFYRADGSSGDGNPRGWDFTIFQGSSATRRFNFVYNSRHNEAFAGGQTVEIDVTAGDTCTFTCPTATRVWGALCSIAVVYR
jgi:hypothetical protein